MTADLLRRAADLIEQAATEAAEQGHHYAGVRLIGDEWAALLSLPVAAPLAAWLRHIATEWDRIAHLDDGTSDHPALAFARAVLGGT